jgi:hypothetical protein
MHPQRVGVRNLVEPLGIAGTRMDQRRQAEGRQQDVFTLVVINLIPMHMALDIAWHGVLRPVPVTQGRGEQFELA